MRKSKFSEHQIIAILKAVEAGRPVKDDCREHEILWWAGVRGRGVFISKFKLTQYRF